MKNKIISKICALRIDIVILLLFISLISCATNDESKKKVNINITYYISSIHKISEQIEVEQIVKKKGFKIYIYKYANLQEENDSLQILGEDVRINNVKLDYISNKNYNYGKGSLEIKKYILESPHSSTVVFMNDSVGLVLFKIINSTSNSTIVEYNSSKEINNIINQIIVDKEFFDYWSK
jgi:hypothetical protein